MTLEGLKGVDHHWPPRRRRTPALERREARFRVDFDQAFDELVNELDRLGIERATLCADVDFRQPSPLPEPLDPGVVIRFTYAGRQHVMACDKWTLLKDNLRAIGRTIKRVRHTEQDGVGTFKEGLAAFAVKRRAEHWWQVVLGVEPAAPWEEVKAAYRRAAKSTHPDTGAAANEEAFRSVQRAYETAQAYYQR